MQDTSVAAITALLRDITAERFDPLSEETLTGDALELARVLNQVHRDRLSLMSASGDRSRLIIDATPVAICITNQDGIYEYANPRYRELTGYDETEIVGRSFLQVVPEEHKVELSDLHEAFMGRRAELEGQWEIIAKDGHRISILANAAYIVDFDGRPKKVTFVTDITELQNTRRRLEEELVVRHQLEQVREQVERVMRHDLRNPLDGIRTAADYLLEEGLEAQHAEFVRLMRDAALRARRQIDNSLAYARMTRGEYAVTHRRINVASLVRDALRALHDASRVYHASVVTSLDESSVYDVELWGEEDFVSDAFTNIVRNAIEASGDGDVVRVEVDGEATLPDGVPAVRMAVTNPVDVPEDIRDRFFEAYVTSGKAGGTGLGTFTAHLVARAHRGTIALETGTGATTVTIVLPRARPGDPTPP